MSEDAVTVEVRGSVALVTLNRPDALNSANEELHGRLAHVWGEVAALEGVNAAVLTGAGKAFLAGGDLGLLQRMVDDPELRRTILTEAAAIARAVASFPLPLIAAVNGPAVGLGCSLAGLADLVVIEEGAYLADPHVGLGLVAGDGSALTWPDNIGLQRAKEWILLGGRISADEAFRIGLANRVVPAGESVPEAIKLADRIAAMPPQAVRDTLAALNGPLLARLDEDLDAILGTEAKSFDEAPFQKNLRKLLERSKA